MNTPRLVDVEDVKVQSDVVISTLETLQAYGKHGYEGLVLWIGEISGKVAIVSQAVVPEQNPISSESGVGYFVDGDTLFRLNRMLANTGLRLIAQVHSHPTNAYHSEADDRYAIVTAEGGLSLVVPNFGRAPLDPAMWATYRLMQGEWKGLSVAESRALLNVGV